MSENWNTHCSNKWQSEWSPNSSSDSESSSQTPSIRLPIHPDPQKPTIERNRLGQKRHRYFEQTMSSDCWGTCHTQKMSNNCSIFYLFFWLQNLYFASFAREEGCISTESRQSPPLVWVQSIWVNENLSFIKLLLPLLPMVKSPTW